MNKKIINVSMCVLFLIAVLPVTVDAISVDDKPELFVTTHARIDWHQVVVPFGRFLLIRKGNKIGAIRFTEFHRGNDAKSPSTSNEGKATEYAEYDWTYQNDGSGDFKKSNVKKGHNKLVDKPLKGIGRLAFQTGTVNIKFGSFNLYWIYPTSVSFTSDIDCSPKGVELAPTRWKEINDVSVHDKNLQWFRCDEKRKSILISIDEL